MNKKIAGEAIITASEIPAVKRVIDFLPMSAVAIIIPPEDELLAQQFPHLLALYKSPLPRPRQFNFFRRNKLAAGGYFPKWAGAARQI
jgi:hypothetical protein